MRLRRTWTTAGFLLSLALLAVPARADSPDQVEKQLKSLLANLDGAKTPEERRESVRAMGSMPTIRAAERLRKIARTDLDPTLRVEAVQALATSPVAEALDMLLDMVVEGGTRQVRRALGRALADRGGTARLLRVFESIRDDLGRGLVIEALAEDRSTQAVAALEHWARGDDAHLRPEALRALSRHALGASAVSGALLDVLKKHKDIDTVLAGLDVAEALGEAELRPLADLLGSFLDPELRAAVDALKRKIVWFDAVAAAAAAKKSKAEGYGVKTAGPGDAPDPPTPRARVDLVFVYDASGSVTGFLPMIKERIRREVATLRAVGFDLRLGLVCYGDTQRRDGVTTRIEPLSYDLSKLEPFLDAEKARGCDSPVIEGLGPALDRMGWRWGAQRHVALIADSKTNDAHKSRALAKLHYDADQTRLRVWYLYRTRTQLPADIAELAHVGGGVTESLE